MVTSRVTRITLVTRYLIGRFNLRTAWTRVLHATFQNNKLKKGRWSWISNCGEAFHIDSWLGEANPGHSDRDAILQALLPGPRYGSTLGPGKARMGLGMLTWKTLKSETIFPIWFPVILRHFRNNVEPHCWFLFLSFFNCYFPVFAVCFSLSLHGTHDENTLTIIPVGA